MGHIYDQIIIETYANRGRVFGLTISGGAETNTTVRTSGLQCVILLHGLVRTSQSMNEIENKLNALGYFVVNNSYPSTTDRIENLANETVPAAISECPKNAEINFVTHSMGGILVRTYYTAHPEAERPRAVVMMGPPNHGSEIIDDPAYDVVGAPINGMSGYQLSAEDNSFVNQLGPVDYPTGIIAGNISLNPIYSEIIPGPDDGKVSVENTKVDGMTDHITLPTTHTFIMINNGVIDQIENFLDEKKFDHDAVPDNPFDQYIIKPLGQLGFNMSK